MNKIMKKIRYIIGAYKGTMAFNKAVVILAKYCKDNELFKDDYYHMCERVKMEIEGVDVKNRTSSDLANVATKKIIADYEMSRFR